MPTCNGVSAAVFVDGRPLDEYQTRVDANRQEASCWIGSQLGKEFSIVVHSGSRNDVKLVIEMDGSRTNTMRLPPLAHYTIKHCPISDAVQRAFVFSRVQLVDDDELPDASILPGLGTIKLTFTAIRIVGHGDGFTDEVDIPEKRQISERGKKGIQACVGLGQEYYRAPRRHWKCIPMYVIAQLTFQYRPLEYLQAQGIAPIPPPQRPLPLPPARQELPVLQPGKRKRREAEPQPGPSKVTRIHVKREKWSIGRGRKDLKNKENVKRSKSPEVVRSKSQVAILDISDEEDEKLYALRARIDRALAKRAFSNVPVKNEIKKEPTSVFSEVEVIDLT